jgi:hypothetical protein
VPKLHYGTVNELSLDDVPLLLHMHRVGKALLIGATQSFKRKRRAGRQRVRAKI